MFSSPAKNWLNSSRVMTPLLLLVVILTPYSQAANVTSIPLFNEGVQAYNKRSYSEALKKFNALIQSGHNTDMVHYYMALCYQGQNNSYADLCDHCSEAVATDTAQAK